MTEWSQPAPKPSSDDVVVQVLMDERIARLFERRCLQPEAHLAGPLYFSEDDLPTYTIGLVPAPQDREPA